MNWMTSLFIALTFLLSQASAHQCLGECAKESVQEASSDMADHSCCEDWQKENSSDDSHQCNDGHLSKNISLAPEFSLSNSTVNTDHTFLVALLPPSVEFVHSAMVSNTGPPDPQCQLRPKFKLGLYILLQRLRVS